MRHESDTYYQMMDDAVKLLVEFCGRSTDEPGLKDTPARYLRALLEMTGGQRRDPTEILDTQFEVGGPYDEIITLVGIPFCSLCEHHMLPFVGTVDVGYLPQERVVGLSKLARLVDCFSKRLQIQERMTQQIAQALMADPLKAKGAAVVVRSEHMCMSCRGVRKPGARMITSAMLGAFRDSDSARAEFMALCKG